MRKMKLVAAAVTLCAGAGMFAISANAAEPANLSGCLQAAKNVRTAIAQNQNSAKIRDAKRQQRYGLQFCNRGFHMKGLSHYSAALKMLDATQMVGANQSG